MFINLKKDKTSVKSCKYSENEFYSLYCFWVHFNPYVLKTIFYFVGCNIFI